MLLAGTHLGDRSDSVKRGVIPKRVHLFYHNPIFLELGSEPIEVLLFGTHRGVRNNLVKKE